MYSQLINIKGSRLISRAKLLSSLPLSCQIWRSSFYLQYRTL